MTPAAPTFAPVCGAAPAITTPDDEYFTYTSSQAGDIRTITAELRPGLDNIEADPDATLSWTYNMSFEPVTITMLTPADIEWRPSSRYAFTIGTPETFAFLQGHQATYAISIGLEATGLFEVWRNDEQVISYGTTEQIGDRTDYYTGLPVGHAVDFTWTSKEGMNATERAAEYFGPLREGERIVPFSFDSTPTWILTVTYVDECGTTRTVETEGPRPGFLPYPPDLED